MASEERKIKPPDISSEIIVENDRYCIKFDLPTKEKVTASQFIKGMENLLEGFEEFTDTLLKSSHIKLEVLSYIEDIEKGSIKLWLRDKIKDISDDDIRDLTSFLPTLPFFLIKAKKVVIKWINTQESAENKQEGLEKDLQDIINNPSLPNKTLFPKRINKTKIFEAAEKISDALPDLANVTFIDTEGEELPIKGKFPFKKNSINEEEITEETIQTITTNIKIRKANFNKKAKKWEFDFLGNKHKVDISNEDVKSYLLSVGLHAGDVFKVSMEIKEIRDSDNNIKVEYKILKILE